MFKRLGDLIGRRASVRPANPRAALLAEYDRALKVDLKAMPRREQAAFAAACAERLHPAYVANLEASGRDDDGLIRRALDLAWDGATTGGVPDADSSEVVEQCVALIPGADAEFTVPPFVDDSIAAVAYALTAAIGLDPNAAGWAATRVTDALDDFVRSTDIEAALPGAGQRVWDHPLVQVEIGRRRKDLEGLLASSDWAATVAAVRMNAARVSALPLDQLDHGAG